MSSFPTVAFASSFELSVSSIFPGGFYGKIARRAHFKLLYFTALQCEIPINNQHGFLVNQNLTILFSPSMCRILYILYCMIGIVMLLLQQQHRKGRPCHQCYCYTLSSLSPRSRFHCRCHSWNTIVIWLDRQRKWMCAISESHTHTLPQEGCEAGRCGRRRTMGSTTA